MSDKNNFLAKYGSKEHIDSVIHDGEYAWDIAENPNATEDHITHLVNSGNNSVSQRNDLTPEHIDKLLARQNSSSATIARNIVRNSPKLEPHHIDHVLKIDDGLIDERLASRPDLQPQHIDHLIKQGGTYTKLGLLINPNLQPHHIDRLSKDPNALVYDRANILKKSLENG